LGGSEVSNNDVYSYGSYRQHNFSSTDSLLPSYSTFVDGRSLDKFYSYNLNAKTSKINAIPNLKTSYNSNEEPIDLFKTTQQSQYNINNALGANNIFFNK
jgi:hypothetical protein